MSDQSLSITLWDCFTSWAYYCNFSFLSELVLFGFTQLTYIFRKKKKTILFLILAIKLLIVYLILSEKSVTFSQAHNILLFLDLSDDLLNVLQNFVKNKTNLFLKITVPLQFSLPSVFCAVHSRESIDDLFPFHHICGLRSLDPAFIYRCLLRWFCFLAFLFFC